MTKEILPINAEPSTLTRRQILDQLQQQLDEFDWVYLKSNFEDKELLVNAIMNSSMPGTLLNFLAKHFTAQTAPEMDVTFKKRLKLWLKDFKKEHQDHTSSIAVKTDSGISYYNIPVIGEVIRLIRKLFSF